MWTNRARPISPHTFINQAHTPLSIAYIRNTPHYHSIVVRHRSIRHAPLVVVTSSALLPQTIICNLHTHRHTRQADTRMSQDADIESPTHRILPPHYIASQRFGPGHNLHYTLRDDSSPSSVVQSSSPILAHTTDQDRIERLRENEKQQLLRAIFGRAIGDGQFSPRWYPIATILAHFLPQHYPHSVNEYYITYSKWVFLGSVLGTASSVLSMQCLLVSLGLGAAALPTSAAINWVLKDGLGQMGGMLFASLVSTRFDMQPIRYRLLSAIVLDASIVLEILTPLVPSLFLPLASLANIGKNISWLGASASRAAIHRSFLRRENLADLTAKSGSQTILASLGGTALGIGLSCVTGTDTLPILACFLVLSGGHLFSTYRALRNIVINHVTDTRLNLLTQQYVTQLHSSQPSNSHTVALATPEQLQRIEPILRSQSTPSPPPTLAPASPSSPIHFPSWANSSVDYAPRFDDLVTNALAKPNLIITDNESNSSAGAASSSLLYHLWMSQFTGIPFVSSLTLSSDPHHIAEWSGQLTFFHRCRFAVSRWLRQFRSSKDQYSRVFSVPPASDNPLTTFNRSNSHLRICILFKSDATSDDILQSHLYLTTIRDGFQHFIDQPRPYDAADIESHLLTLHHRALELIRSDSAQVGILPSSQPTNSLTDLNHPQSTSSSKRSHFVATLQSFGYSTENPFVQDDNPNRVTIVESK